MKEHQQHQFISSPPLVEPVKLTLDNINLEMLQIDTMGLEENTFTLFMQYGSFL